MPFDLPPPLPPQLTETEIAEERAIAAGDVIELQAEDFRLLITGNTYLSERHIRQETDAGRTASDKIRRLNALYAEAGYPLVNVTYAPHGDLVYVHVHEGVLRDVEAPELLAPFFRDLVDTPDLRHSQMEKRRVLAALKADRAGLQVESSYASETPQAPGDFTLRLHASGKPGHRPLRLRSSFGNPGNRFLGRYFAGAGFGLSGASGDRWDIDYTGALTGLSDNGQGQSFHQVEGGYETVRTFGLYSAEVSHTRFAAESFGAFFPGSDGAAQIELSDARIYEGLLSGGQLLFANGRHRWAIEQDLGYVRSVIDATEAEESDIGELTPEAPELLPDITGNGNESRSRVQDERYFTARIGTQYSNSMRPADRPSVLGFGVGFTHGLSGDSGTLNRDAEGPLRRTARFRLVDALIEASHRLPRGFGISTHVRGQYALSDRQVPQQQQWVLGGPDSLSAFLPGILVGDTGVYGQVELGLPRWIIFGWPYRLALFVEGGSARFNDVPRELGQTRAASSYGIKLEANILRHLVVAIHLADELSTSKLDADFVDDNAAKVIFSLRGSW